jgi:hypothetical protein
MFEKLFIAAKGKPVEYKGDKIFMLDTVVLPVNSPVKKRLEFVSSNSDWKQAVILETEGFFELNGQRAPNKIILWIDTAPTIVDMIITSVNGKLLIYNAWKIPNGAVHYWHNGGAMKKDNLENGLKYFCNDGFPDDDFDDLVFELQEV